MFIEGAQNLDKIIFFGKKINLNFISVQNLEIEKAFSYCKNDKLFALPLLNFVKLASQMCVPFQWLPL